VVGLGVPVGVGVGVGPIELTSRSSNDAVAWNVAKPTVPLPNVELVPDPIWAPLTNPVTDVPDTWICSEDQVPVVTVSAVDPRTVPEPLLTVCSCAWFESRSARRYSLVALCTRALSATKRVEAPKASGLTRACTE